MKFIPITSTEMDTVTLKKEFDAATSYAKARVGEHMFFYPLGLFRYGYLPYSEVVWAFRRLEQLRRGSASYTVNKLVLVTKERKQLEYIIHRDGSSDCLKRMSQNYPEIEIGYEDSKAKKYL